jgi:cyclophilin family peptidyl-prolyl cis-trans isomerase
MNMNMRMIRMNNFSRKLYNFPRRVFGVAQNITDYTSKENPRVFFTIAKDGKNLGNMTFELYQNHNPKTAENFKQLCSGDNKQALTYKNNIFHRIITGFMAQGGDITKGNGTGGMSIYGRNFKDENMTLRHYKRGQLSMANSGPDTNGSQFFITFAPCPWLDAYHCVFGELVEGENVLKEIEAIGTREGKPRGEIKVVDCGVVKAASH